MKALIAVALLASMPAFSQEDFVGSGFSAPTVAGKGNVYDPQVGDIVYDSSDSTFYGRNHGSGWTPLGNSATAPTQTIYLSGSGTYTTPANVVWLRVRMVGGGGGGAAGGTTVNAEAGDGGNTTFGSSFKGRIGELGKYSHSFAYLESEKL